MLNAALLSLKFHKIAGFGPHHLTKHASLFDYCIQTLNLRQGNAQPRPSCRAPSLLWEIVGSIPTTWNLYWNHVSEAARFPNALGCTYDRGFSFVMEKLAQTTIQPCWKIALRSCWRKNARPCTVMDNWDMNDERWRGRKPFSSNNSRAWLCAATHEVNK